jgi:hypothetical protein
MFLRIAAGQKNRENDQHRHCADINEHQRKSDELCTQQKKERCEPEQRQHQAERRVHEIWQRRGCQRPGEH